MLKKEKKNRFLKGVCRLIKGVAILEANSTCPYLSYQPSMSEKVKKLRKF